MLSRKSSENFPEIVEPLFCGPNFPPNFPPKNQKNHRLASAGAQGEQTEIPRLSFCVRL